MMKKFFLGLIALAGIAVFSAFAISDTVSKTNDEVWFEYQPVNGNGPTDPANYIETGMNPECEDVEGSLCSVFAEADDTSGDPGERKPLASSLTAIQNGPGFDDYVEDLIHLRE